MSLPLWKCTECHHEWQGLKKRACDWCGSPSEKLGFWHDFEAVKKHALKLGPGQTVYKPAYRNTYNITHTSRKDIWANAIEVFHT